MLLFVVFLKAFFSLEISRGHLEAGYFTWNIRWLFWLGPSLDSLSSTAFLCEYLKMKNFFIYKEFTSLEKIVSYITKVILFKYAVFSY